MPEFKPFSREEAKEAVERILGPIKEADGLYDYQVCCYQVCCDRNVNGELDQSAMYVPLRFIEIKVEITRDGANFSEIVEGSNTPNGDEQ